MTLRATRPWLPYLAAVVATVLACLLSWALAPFMGPTIFYLLFFAAVVFSSIYGGFGPGVVATLATYGAGNVFFVSEKNAFVFNAGAILYLIISLTMAAIGEAAKRSRRRAAASAQEVVSVLQTIDEGFIAIDDNWRPTFINRAAEQLRRGQRGSALGMPLAEILPVLTHGSAEAQLKQAAHDQVTVEFETFYEPWQQWFEVKASPAAAGGLGIFVRDITDRKRDQLALALSEERLRFAQHGAKAGLWDWDMVTGQVIWSDAYYEINGLDHTVKPSRENYLNAIHPDDRDMVDRTIREAIDARDPIDIEYRIVHPHRGIRWVAARGHTAVDSSWRPLRTSGIVLDITARKQAEEALRLLSEAGTVLSTLVDFRSTMQSVARLSVASFADWCVVHGLTPASKIECLSYAHRDAESESLVRTVLEHYPLDRDSQAPAPTVLRSGRPELAAHISPRVLDAMAPDGRQVLAQLDPRSMIAVPLLVRDKTVGVLSFFRGEEQSRFTTADVELATELARRAATANENAHLYEELKEAQRQKDDFLAMLAHELRNPLAAISYANEVSKITAEAPGEMTDTIDRQLAHLCRMLDDLLDVSRITRDKVQLKFELVDGVELARHAAETVLPLINARKHELVFNMPEAPIPLFVDPIRVEQMMGNLLTNAAKYTPEGGRITVRAAVEHDVAIITVTDTGVGVAPELLPRIFDLFMQVDGSLDHSQGGLGLGLTLVRKLAELHGGSVSAKSEGPGTGSEFTVRLPLADERRLSAAATPSGADATRKLKVLMVDDNVDMVHSVSKLLKLCGHKVATAHDGLAALEAARSFAPDVILLDLGLPGMDGYGVARTLRREGALPAIRLIALSGYGQPEDRARTHDAGFDQHLVKPVRLQTLLSALADT